MNAFGRHAALRLWIAGLYALAMLCVGAAHLGADGQAPVIALPDGTVLPICAVPADGGEESGSAGVCDACLISAGPGLPPCPVLLVGTLRPPETLGVRQPARQIRPGSRLPHVAYLRGPPGAILAT